MPQRRILFVRPRAPAAAPVPVSNTIDSAHQSAANDVQAFVRTSHHQQELS